MSKSHFLYSAEGKDILNREYVNAGHPTRIVAEILSSRGIETYHTLVRRALRFHSLPIRNHASAQSEALKSDRAAHPTKGTTRPDSIKSQISSKLKTRNIANGNGSSH